MAEDWVVVRNCLNVYDAFLVRSALEGSDIECYLPDEHVATIRPGTEVALGGVRVLVHRDDFERAAEALSSPLASVLATEAPDGDDDSAHGEKS